MNSYKLTSTSDTSHSKRIIKIHALYLYFCSMDIQARKLDLINWLSSLTDESLVNMLYDLKQNSNSNKVKELLENKQYLSQQIKCIDNNTAEFISIQKLDQLLDSTISQYEN